MTAKKPAAAAAPAVPVAPTRLSFAYIETLVAMWMSRFAALFDGSAWLLAAPAIAALWLLDSPMVKSLLQWSLYFSIMAAFVVIISRVAFPQVKLGEFIEEAKNGNPAAGMIVSAVIMFVAIVLIAMAVWARPSGS